MLTRQRSARGLAMTRSIAGIATLGVLFLPLTLAACGDDDGSSSDTGAPTTTTGGATSAAPAGQGGATTVSPTTPAAAGSLGGTSWTLSSAMASGQDVPAVNAATLAFGADGTSLT